MPDGLTFRTTDNTRWGTGYGADLPAALIDLNFWILYTQIAALQAGMANAAGIANIVINSATTFSVVLTNHLTLGPYPLPVASFNWTGTWEANSTYNINDVFSYQDANGINTIYLVTYPVTDSGSTFYAFSNSGPGKQWYVAMIASPASDIPAGGITGQFLMQGAGESPGGAVWYNITRNIAYYGEVEPEPLEIVLRYVCPEKMTFPQSLVGSVGSCTGHSTSDEQAYEIYWNGANVGSINFNASPTAPSFTFPHAIIMEPNDVLEVVAPSVPDPHLYGVAFTLVGVVNLLPVT